MILRGSIMPYSDPSRARQYQRDYRRTRRSGDRCTTPVHPVIPIPFRLQTAQDVIDLLQEQVAVDRAQISLDRVHDFVGDYIESQGATRPTEMMKDKESLPIGLIVFLTECCTPDILGSSMWYSSREDLLKERLSLCEQLVDRFQFREPELQQEIAALTRQLPVSLAIVMR